MHLPCFQSSWWVFPKDAWDLRKMQRLHVCSRVCICILACNKNFQLANQFNIAGADPGFFLGGGAPLRNDITDGEVKKKNQIRIHEEESFISGGGAHPLHPPPRSAPVHHSKSSCKSACNGRAKNLSQPKTDFALAFWVSTNWPVIEYNIRDPDKRWIESDRRDVAIISRVPC